MYKLVDLYDEPEVEIKKILNSYHSEMTTFQHSFLCGLIKENEPKKIVEIGVSAGGTTALIIHCLNMLNIQAEMYSIDLMEKWYLNEKYETGFLMKNEFRNFSGNVNHNFMLGHTIPHYIEDIGSNIDFLVLDTTHTLPGELLDFIICLPYLKEGCIVVLHDTVENHLNYSDNQIATKLLFDIVRAENKYYMWEEENNIAGLSNIAAFKVGRETIENIRDLFSAMTISWGYLMDDHERQNYRKIIKSNYSNKYVQLYDRVELLQRNTYLQKSITEHFGKDAEILKMKWKKEKIVILYGAGYYADLYYQWAMINDLNISGLVISDGQDKGSNIGKRPLPVYYLTELPFKPDECVIIIAVNKGYQRVILKSLREAGYNNIL